MKSMPTISSKKREKISEQILHYLFSVSPESKFTVDVAKEIARDEEFTKAMLKDLQKKNLIQEINKNSLGKTYLKRQRWRLSSQVFDIYSKHQNPQNHSLFNPQTQTTQSRISNFNPLDEI